MLGRVAHADLFFHLFNDKIFKVGKLFHAHFAKGIVYAKLPAIVFKNKPHLFFKMLVLPRPDRT